MKFWYGLFACVVLLGFLRANGWAQEAETEEATLEPTATETLVLEMINRARATPRQEAPLCTEVERVMRGVDQDIFSREMQTVDSSDPVFFDPRLVEAARKHSAYQALHGTCHDQVRGEEGFTGVDASARAQAAGFPVVSIGENVATGFTQAEEIHAGFIVDPVGAGGEGPGGMQPERPHRVVTFHPNWRLVGVGCVEESDGASTIVYAGADQRFVGGVIYCDLDGDGFYSEGEGIGDTVISNGRTIVQGYQSGAYTIPVNAAGGRIEFRIGPLTYMRRYPRGNKNAKVDLVLSEEEAATMRTILELQEQLLAGARSADLNETIELYQKIRQEFGNSALEPWLRDVEVGLQMRQVYIDTANRYLGGNLPSEAELTQTLQQLQTMHGSINTPQWQEFGGEIGAAFLKLGRTGEIDSELISTESITGDFPNP